MWIRTGLDPCQLLLFSVTIYSTYACIIHNPNQLYIPPNRQARIYYGQLTNTQNFQNSESRDLVHTNFSKTLPNFEHHGKENISIVLTNKLFKYKNKTNVQRHFRRKRESNIVVESGAGDNDVVANSVSKNSGDAVAKAGNHNENGSALARSFAKGSGQSKARAHTTNNGDATAMAKAKESNSSAAALARGTGNAFAASQSEGKGHAVASSLTLGNGSSQAEAISEDGHALATAVRGHEHTLDDYNSSKNNSTGKATQRQDIFDDPFFEEYKKSKALHKKNRFDDSFFDQKSANHNNETHNETSIVVSKTEVPATTVETSTEPEETPRPFKMGGRTMGGAPPEIESEEETTTELSRIFNLLKLRKPLKPEHKDLVFIGLEDEPSTSKTTTTKQPDTTTTTIPSTTELVEEPPKPFKMGGRTMGGAPPEIEEESTTQLITTTEFIPTLPPNKTFGLVELDDEQINQSKPGIVFISLEEMPPPATTTESSTTELPEEPPKPFKMGGRTMGGAPPEIEEESTTQLITTTELVPTPPPNQTFSLVELDDQQINQSKPGIVFISLEEMPPPTTTTESSTTELPEEPPKPFKMGGRTMGGAPPEIEEESTTEIPTTSTSPTPKPIKGIAFASSVTNNSGNAISYASNPNEGGNAMARSSAQGTGFSNATADTKNSGNATALAKSIGNNSTSHATSGDHGTALAKSLTEGTGNSVASSHSTGNGSSQAEATVDNGTAIATAVFGGPQKIHEGPFNDDVFAEAPQTNTPFTLISTSEQPRILKEIQNESKTGLIPTTTETTEKILQPTTTTKTIEITSTTESFKRSTQKIGEPPTERLESTTTKVTKAETSFDLPKFEQDEWPPNGEAIASALSHETGNAKAHANNPNKGGSALARSSATGSGYSNATAETIDGGNSTALSKAHENNSSAQAITGTDGSAVSKSLSEGTGIAAASSLSKDNGTSIAEASANEGDAISRAIVTAKEKSEIEAFVNDAFFGDKHASTSEEPEPQKPFKMGGRTMGGAPPEISEEELSTTEYVSTAKPKSKFSMHEIEESDIASEKPKTILIGLEDDEPITTTELTTTTTQLTTTTTKLTSTSEEPETKKPFKMGGRTMGGAPPEIEEESATQTISTTTFIPIPKPKSKFSMHEIEESDIASEKPKTILIGLEDDEPITTTELTTTTTKLSTTSEEPESKKPFKMGGRTMGGAPPEIEEETTTQTISTTPFIPTTKPTRFSLHTFDQNSLSSKKPNQVLIALEEAEPLVTTTSKPTIPETTQSNNQTKPAIMGRTLGGSEPEIDTESTTEQSNKYNLLKLNRKKLKPEHKDLIFIGLEDEPSTSKTTTTKKPDTTTTTISSTTELPEETPKPFKMGGRTMGGAPPEIEEETTETESTTVQTTTQPVPTISESSKPKKELPPNGNATASALTHKDGNAIAYANNPNDGGIALARSSALGNGTSKATAKSADGGNSTALAKAHVSNATAHAISGTDGISVSKSHAEGTGDSVAVSVAKGNATSIAEAIADEGDAVASALFAVPQKSHAQTFDNDPFFGDAPLPTTTTATTSTTTKTTSITTPTTSITTPTTSITTTTTSTTTPTTLTPTPTTSTTTPTTSTTTPTTSTTTATILTTTATTEKTLPPSTTTKAIEITSTTESFRGSTQNIGESKTERLEFTTIKVPKVETTSGSPRSKQNLPPNGVAIASALGHKTGNAISHANNPNEGGSALARSSATGSGYSNATAETIDGGNSTALAKAHEKNATAQAITGTDGFAVSKSLSEGTGIAAASSISKDNGTSLAEASASEGDAIASAVFVANERREIEAFVNDAFFGDKHASTSEEPEPQKPFKMGGRTMGGAPPEISEEELSTTEYVSTAKPKSKFSMHEIEESDIASEKPKTILIGLEDDEPITTTQLTTTTTQFTSTSEEPETQRPFKMGGRTMGGAPPEISEEEISTTEYITTAKPKSKFSLHEIEEGNFASEKPKTILIGLEDDEPTTTTQLPTTSEEPEPPKPFKMGGRTMGGAPPEIEEESTTQTISTTTFIPTSKPKSKFSLHEIEEGNFASDKPKTILIGLEDDEPIPTTQLTTTTNLPSTSEEPETRRPFKMGGRTMGGAPPEISEEEDISTTTMSIVTTLNPLVQSRSFKHVSEKTTEVPKKFALVELYDNELQQTNSSLVIISINDTDTEISTTENVVQAKPNIQGRTLDGAPDIEETSTVAVTTTPRSKFTLVLENDKSVQENKSHHILISLEDATTQITTTEVLKIVTSTETQLPSKPHIQGRTLEGGPEILETTEIPKTTEASRVFNLLKVKKSSRKTEPNFVFLSLDDEPKISTTTSTTTEMPSTTDSAEVQRPFKMGGRTMGGAPEISEEEDVSTSTPKPQPGIRSTTTEEGKVDGYNLIKLNNHKLQDLGPGQIAIGLQGDSSESHEITTEDTSKVTTTTKYFHPGDIHVHSMDNYFIFLHQHMLAASRHTKKPSESIFDSTESGEPFQPAPPPEPESVEHVNTPIPYESAEHVESKS